MATASLRPTPADAAPVLPPPFGHVATPPGADPFAHAMAIAPDHGAGALVWAPGGAVAGFAVVLEPDAPLGGARRAFFAAMAALGDAVAAHCPPEREVAFLWPDVVQFDTALLGGARLGWPAGCAEDEGPDWLVFGASLWRDRAGLVEPGRAPNSTSMAEEGFGDDRALVESFARYLMLHVDVWATEGFERMARSYLDRLADRGPAARIGPTGDLVAPGAEPRRLREGLDAARWREPAGWGPRL